MVGPPRLGGTGPQPVHQGVPVADGGHVWFTALQRATSLAVAEESLAWRAQAAVAALEVVALVGTGPGQLQALIDIWGEQGQVRGGWVSEKLGQGGAWRLKGGVLRDPSRDRGFWGSGLGEMGTSRGTRR